MANITLSQLNNAGAELFQDSESFLNELKDVDAIVGGGSDSASASDTYYGYHVSDISSLTKLAEAFVMTYSIGHVTFLAKSFSHGY
ncbi:hypothetical protein [Umezakia ovalisporum]|jgi:hypothetical protein|uniref:Uncharacterized protein n=2 Tax=Umezakia ovalisporum TaxID=75695 RepID=A0AA43GVI5_9CYAN|nr:hypothetical protein [Umezakia ovalisporum]MBI1241630.1 hypothetical protein [Nostoc sp. RI_552]MDH6056098.1 hypothetical protein [Umezakia ovalisporum FSS-43]MDH6062541.1 hypothetical protein [Umezakia ovalisporum FSS-62]MDH6068283.1 hypothetical protein [Umezakia ovalisporum APH033B]MDH6069862.1 hypothetical protein [Umezakia ovalisporum CobakiLakeA]